MTSCCGGQGCDQCKEYMDREDAFSDRAAVCEYLEEKERHRVISFTLIFYFFHQTPWFKSRVAAERALRVLCFVFGSKRFLIETEREYVCHYQTVDSVISALQEYGNDRNWEQLSDAMLSAVKSGKTSFAELAEPHDIEVDVCDMDDCPEETVLD